MRQGGQDRGDGIHPHPDRGRQGGPQVAKDILDITGVQQAQAVTGPYDVIVRAEAHNLDELGQLVVARVQAVDGITRTLTCPVVHLA
jgi:DNA-binding Lrp family transcriptional regulator